MTIKRKFKKVIVYVCITFFVIAVAFVTITFRAKSQAGLIEVGCAALLFVIFLNILKRVIPHSSGMIVTILSLLFAIMLLLANFSMQKKRHSEYTFKEFMIGDFLVKKIMGIHKEKPDALLAKKLENIIPGEFTQTKTEKSTIESPFEKPQKDLMGEPVFLPLDELNQVQVRKEKFHAFSIPKETVSYKLEFADIEGFNPGRPKMFMPFIDNDFSTMNIPAVGNKVWSPLYLPSEVSFSIGPLHAIFSKSEKEAERLVPEIQQPTLDKYLPAEPAKQVMEALQIP
ncbi:MAG: hypothetical protein D8M57_10070 [Candidatus Scalindua sp. AMX11]|nr:MAG: hypothetical protein DWQ00_08820 [Candidatus Scalindua sp.]NOG84848.1 hypothetical protein [Planctomycetota bacterium]RZV84918.1 MAG: hypothetical protein EX341_07880 [Candidatus Scalindua sp. SCAELEC01]TDE65091.1 MAG: hypothetical protein D8M57_10070 [Candidatus Scalindua sp. AMX11]GJQ59483.1 MAG: hypothetical protein SCALA701_22840 [Candidatus Scalindua sp.]